jgi:hypothetical protein
MARIRSIHPEACTSEKLARVSAEAERCYWRLQTHCDDEGRAEDNPRLIWAALFPLLEDVDPVKVDGWLLELAVAGLIERYEVEGRRYLAVTQWERFQHPQRPRPSKIPEPSCALPVPVRDKDATPRVDVVPGEGEGVGDEEGGEIAPRTARDPVWDALIKCWQIEQAELTKAERDRVNNAAKALRDIGADPDEIPARRAMYALLFPHAAQTMMALVNRWAECRPDPARLPHTPGRNTPAIAKAIARAQ